MWSEDSVSVSENRNDLTHCLWRKCQLGEGEGIKKKRSTP